MDFEIRGRTHHGISVIHGGEPGTTPHSSTQKYWPRWPMTLKMAGVIQIDEDSLPIPHEHLGE
jgi:hypothetical protein